MIATNMGGGRKVCGCILVILLLDFQLVAAKPFFGGRMWCDLFCEDDDDVSTPSTTTSLEDALDALFDPCTDCPTRRPPTVMPGMPGMPGMPAGMPGPWGQPFNFMIPPSQNGMNLTMTPNGAGSWFMNIIPWGGSPATPNPTPAPATTAAPTTAGGAATTAAPAATTAAPGATTAAPTTAAG